ncbi:hypothetical protein SAMN05216226_103193 [Halovenus aranensis]|jgi:hypothetical protein|uniref:Uncharacterized protein n=1 Tax=Halovenus aranensis TaxID=890420 RepID=A0A1G8TSL5_9EURY|nr:DUF5796 family protein [Halovenus aranensis]SDJ43700.1 hypothetical protein SAMN05216226_103193 [Halovenus aranensis]
MTTFSEVAPATLPVRLVDGGVVVEYLDDREVFYHGVPDPEPTPHTTAPGKDTHVLVTDESETSGVLFYVDERTTEGDILETSGVGRVILDKGETRTLFAGVEATRNDLRYEIDVDEEFVDGRVFVFEEDQFAEYAYELTADP